MNKLQRLRLEADNAFSKACLVFWGGKCEVCNKIANQVHHIKPKSVYGFLRYDIMNGAIMDFTCHRRVEDNDVASKELFRLLTIKRGVDWANKLNEKSREFHSSFQTESWYEENIIRLNKITYGK